MFTLTNDYINASRFYEIKVISLSSNTLIDTMIYTNFGRLYSPIYNKNNLQDIIIRKDTLYYNKHIVIITMKNEYKECL